MNREATKFSFSTFSTFSSCVIFIQNFSVAWSNSISSHEGERRTWKLPQARANYWAYRLWGVILYISNLVTLNCFRIFKSGIQNPHSNHLLKQLQYVICAGTWRVSESRFFWWTSQTGLRGLWVTRQNRTYSFSKFSFYIFYTLVHNV